MAFKQKTWTDRVSEYPTRRILTKEDGSTEVVSVARAEGEISKEGDAFNAENMNDLEQRVGDALAEVLQVVSFDSATGTLITKSADYAG